MEIVVVGLNHKKAPVELREKLAFTPEMVESSLKEMEESEGVILSTCNRVELYAAAESGDAALERLAAFLSRRVPDIADHLYRYQGMDAIRHLFRVSAGLDAMVVGETQILSQVKEAYRAAVTVGRTGKTLNPLFQRAFHAAKRVHTETAISERQVSVSSVAAQLAETIFRNISEKTVLILGAGETGELTLQALHDRGLRKIRVANRTREKAVSIVEKFGGEAHDLERLDELLPAADILITALSTDKPLVSRAAITAAQKVRRNDPAFLIDIAVPRNIDPDVGNIENIYLFNIDDLESIVNQNLVERTAEVKKSDPIIEEEASAFYTELSTVDVTAVVRALRDRVQAVGDEELQRTLQKLESLPEDQREEVQKLVHRLISKILHDPTAAIKEEAANGGGLSLLDLTRKLFKLK